MKCRCHPLRGLALGLALLGVLSAGPARAQSNAAAPASGPAPSAEELTRLVETLQDDKSRAALIAQLRALIEVERRQQAAPAPPTPSGLFSRAAQQLQAVGGELLAAVPVIGDAPRLVGWLRDQASDETRRRFWLDIGLQLVIIFGAGLAAGGLARLLLRRPAQRLNLRAGANSATRLLLLALGVGLDAVPVLLFAGVASFVMPLTQPHFATERVAGLFIAATLWSRLLLAVARGLLLSPNAAAQFRLGAETRAYLYIWLRRFIVWTAYGYAISVGAWWLGTPGAIDGLLERITVFILAVMSVIFILQNRSAVAEWLRGRKPAHGADGGSLAWQVLRNRLADTWHVLAIVYVIGTFAVYVLHVEGGFAFLLRATALSFVVLLAAALLVRFVQRSCARGFAVSAELKARFPTLEARANRYLPLLTILGSTIVYLVAALALLQVWGIDSFDWIALLAQHKATGSVITTAILVLAALTLWELFSTTIERYLSSLDSDSRRSARTRTLLPLLRTTVLVIMVGMVALIVLSELGLNITPLLAGAGVAGIAVGFGAQTLVKDVITGFLFLLEDTFAVGDFVDIGKGHAGTIEAISIRNFRLRDIAGAVHTVPFSEVSIVLNMTRDFAYVVCDAGVVFREDPDRVIAVLREVGAGLAGDRDWAPCLMEPLEILGVEKFTDSAMVIRARIKAAPLKQWALGREFNRRLKKAFDAHGIEMPAANQTDYLTTKPAPTPAPAASG